MEQEGPPPSAARLRLGDLNSHLVCVLCRGYLVDATTIVECLHSFCRSCLVRHLERVATACPSCEAPLPKARPFLHIRSDKTLQDIVYKLVPGLYRAEMQRRRHFFAQHPQHACFASPEQRGVSMERLVFSPEDHFSLSLEYFAPQVENLRITNTGDDWDCTSSKSSESGCSDGTTNTAEGGPAKRYLQCPALFTVRLLKKFIRNKFELEPRHRIDVIHRRVCLPDDYTLMDVAYIYSWRQSAPMQFYYRIYHDADEIKSSKKRPHASEPVLDELPPPPPAKLERIQEKSSNVPQEKTAAAVASNKIPPLQPLKVKSPPPLVVKTPPAVSENKVVSVDLGNISELQVQTESKLQSHVTITPPRDEIKVSTSEKSVSPPAEGVPTSPSKSRPKVTGASRAGQSSILSIAQNLARKQQEQQQARKLQGQTDKTPPPPAEKSEVKENVDKFKSIQPKPLSEPRIPTHALPQQYQPSKRPYPPQKQSPQTPNDNLIKVPLSEPVKAAPAPQGAKKPKLHQEDILRQTLSKSHTKPPTALKVPSSAARTRPSPGYMNSMISPFAPMHRPHPHPIRIPAPPKQRPSSLSSSSSPSPSPPADVVSPGLCGRPSQNGGDVRSMFQGQGAATAAAIFMRQQLEHLEMQSRLIHPGPDWAHPSLHPHPFLNPPSDWLNSAESAKRLEVFMRSLSRSSGHPMMFPPYRPPNNSSSHTPSVAHAAAPK